MPYLEVIKSVVVVDGNVVITLMDDTYMVLTLDQLLRLGVTRHRIPSDPLTPPTV